MDKDAFIAKTNSMKPYINLQEVSHHCGYSYDTVRKYILDSYRSTYSPVIAEVIYNSCVIMFERRKAEMLAVNR